MFPLPAWPQSVHFNDTSRKLKHFSPPHWLGQKCIKTLTPKNVIRERELEKCEKHDGPNCFWLGSPALTYLQDSEGQRGKRGGKLVVTGYIRNMEIFTTERDSETGRKVFCRFVLLSWTRLWRTERPPYLIAGHNPAAALYSQPTTVNSIHHITNHPTTLLPCLHTGHQNTSVHIELDQNCRRSRCRSERL